MRAHRLRAVEAQRLSGGRLRIVPYGDFGYLVTTRTGRSIVPADLTALVEALVTIGGPHRELVAAARVEHSAGSRAVVAAAVLDHLHPVDVASTSTTGQGAWHDAVDRSLRRRGGP